MKEPQLSVAECELFGKFHLAELRVCTDAILGDRILTAPGEILEMEELVLNGHKVRTWKNVRTHSELILSMCRSLPPCRVKVSGLQPWGCWTDEETRVWREETLTMNQCPRTFRQYFLDSCTKYSDRTFLSSPMEPSGRSAYTFKQVMERAEKLGSWMRRRGLGMGSRIAIGGGNSVGWVET